MMLIAAAAAVTATAGGGWQARRLESGSQLWATRAVAINDRGEILISGLVGDSNTRGFLWRNGKLTNLGMFTASASDALEPTAMNNRGQVVGYASTSSGVRAFLWESGRLVDLGSLPGKTDSRAVAINERGQVAGVSFTRSASGESAPRAFIWEAGRRTDLGTLGGRTSSAAAINDRGEVVGWSTTASGFRHAFVWRNGHMRDLGVLPGKKWSAAVAVSSRGEIVGDSFDGLGAATSVFYDTNGEGAPRAFRWENGKMFPLTPPQTSSVAVAINSAGEIIGHTLVLRSRVLQPGGPRSRWVETRGFLWRNGRTTALDIPRSDSLSDARAINDSSTIVGYSGVVGAYQAYVWSHGKRMLLPDPGGGGHDPKVMPVSINAHDQVVGTRTATMDSSRSVLWTRP